MKKIILTLIMAFAATTAFSVSAQDPANNCPLKEQCENKDKCCKQKDCDKKDCKKDDCRKNDKKKGHKNGHKKGHKGADCKRSDCNVKADSCRRQCPPNAALSNLDLSDEQRSSVKNLSEETRSELAKIHEQAAREAELAKQNFNVKLSSVLTPEQYAQYNERMSTIQQDMKANKPSKKAKAMKRNKRNRSEAASAK